MSGHNPNKHADFAKLYDTHKHGQILVRLVDEFDYMEIVVSFRPAGLGVCSGSVSFIPKKSSKNPYSYAIAARKCFDTFTRKQAKKFVRNLKKELPINLLAHVVEKHDD